MNSPTGNAPERLLSAALRAQASGGAAPGNPVPGNGPTPAPVPRQRLPVWRVLLFAVMLGLIAGGVVGALSML